MVPIILVGVALSVAATWIGLALRGRRARLPALAVATVIAGALVGVVFGERLSERRALADARVEAMQLVEGWPLATELAAYPPEVWEDVVVRGVAFFEMHAAALEDSEAVLGRVHGFGTRNWIRREPADYMDDKAVTYNMARVTLSAIEVVAASGRSN